MFLSKSKIFSHIAYRISHFSNQLSNLNCWFSELRIAGFLFGLWVLLISLCLHKTYLESGIWIYW